MVSCKLCDEQFSTITNTHLSSVHGSTIQNYVRKFGKRGVGFKLSFNDIPKRDFRHKAWREGLPGRASWNRGFTKKTHPGLAKLSETFKSRGIDNFSRWRKWAIEQNI